jgi:hypothetical protein
MRNVAKEQDSYCIMNQAPNITLLATQHAPLMDGSISINLIKQNGHYMYRLL